VQNRVTGGCAGSRIAALGVFLLGWSLLGLGCSQLPSRSESTAIDPGHLYAILINGGGTREQNFQSHLRHVQQLTEMLRSARVPESRITIFSSDGSDPESDVITRTRFRQKNFWMLEGTRAEALLRPSAEFINSTVAGMQLMPASNEALRAWFDGPGQLLGPGDTLLLYVTDHGTRNPEDLTNNNIVMWGRDAKLTVHELLDMLAALRPGVRVVALMSQCYSGSFAHLIDGDKDSPAAAGQICGYFSSTADRPAYGCYPENRDRNNVGHSFQFMRALTESRSFPLAHRQVLVKDDTPDVPLRTSDEYLARILREAAGDGDEATALLTDRLLQEAWVNKDRWEPEIRLLDQIGSNYGTFSPRSLAEIDSQASQLPEISQQMKNTSRAWQAALADANEGNFGRFLAARTDWQEQLSHDALKDLDNEQRRAFTQKLLADFVPYTKADTATAQKLRTLRRNGRSAAAASYRMAVRLGVILRMRKILSSIAGRQYLTAHGTPEQRATYEALVHCEELRLPAIHTGTAEVRETKPFPPFEQDIERAQAALPAWMGIQFREPNPELVAKQKLSPGASQIITVYPGSPAEVAGLEQGDIILGPPGAPFIERAEVRSWVMLSHVGDLRELDIVRGDKPLRVTLVPRPFPLKWPELPGPPAIGSIAPPLSVTPYRGKAAQLVATPGPRLLMFWATWCAPCKASVPEVLAFERERRIPVLAITDESNDRLNAFFKTFTSPFPENVAIDDVRKTLVAYGVSGTPTFVLIDSKGEVQKVITGYNPEKGLDLDGWHWKH